MKNRLSLHCLSLVLAIFAIQQPAKAAVIYDSIAGAPSVTFTGGTPRTYMGQAFSVSDPGGPVLIQSVRVGVVVGGAVNFAASRLRVQLWDTYTAGGTPVFSNPAGSLLVLDTGAINTTAASYFEFSLDFTTPASLTGLANHGITINWQSDAAGTGTFIDDTLLTSALRSGSGGPPPALTVGTNQNPSTGYFRNASGRTDFNFVASDARTLVNANGLMFQLTTVPEPGSVVLIGFAVAGLATRRRRTAA